MKKYATILSPLYSIVFKHEEVIILFHYSQLALYFFDFLLLHEMVSSLKHFSFVKGIKC